MKISEAQAKRIQNLFRKQTLMQKSEKVSEKYLGLYGEKLIPEILIALDIDHDVEVEPEEGLLLLRVAWESTEAETALSV